MAATILETLTVRIVADISDLRLQLAQVKTIVGDVGRDISDTFANHISLGDVIQAGITAPLALAATQASISARTIRTELAEIAALQRAAVGQGLLAGPTGTAVAVGAGTVGGIMIDGTSDEVRRRQQAAAQADGPDGRQIRSDRVSILTGIRDRASDEHERLRASGVNVQSRAEAVRAAQRALDDELERGRRIEHDAEEHRRRSAEESGGGGRRRGGFDIPDEMTEKLGKSAHGVGRAARGVMGSGIAQALGLTGLGALVSSLIPLVADLAAVIGGALAAALAAIITPVGLVVAGLTALVALLVASNWKEFREAIEWIGARFQEVMGERFVSIVAAASEALAALAYAFKPVTDAFGAGGDEMSATMKAVAEAFIRALDAVGAVIEGFLKLFANVVRTIGALIQGDWKTALMSFHQIFVDLIAAIVDVVTSLFPELQAAWDKNWPALREWMGGGFKGFVDDIGKEVDRAVGFFRRLFGARDDAMSGGAGADGVKGYAGSDTLGEEGPFGSMLKGYKRSMAGIKGAAARDFSEIGDQITFQVSGALEEAVMSGRRLNDVMRELGRTLVAIAFRKLITEPFEDMLGSIFSGGSVKGGKAANSNGGGIGSILGSIASTVVGAAIGGKLGASTGKIASASSMNVGDLASAGAGMVFNDNRVIDARGADPAAIARLERVMAADRASRKTEFASMYADLRARRG